MDQKKAKQVSPLRYAIVARKNSKDRIYLLLRFSLSRGSTTARRRFLKRFMEKRNAIGLIEWWTKGSIVKKPNLQFYGILVSKT